MPDEHVSDASKTSGEANPMDEKPANPTEAQLEMQAKQVEQDQDDGNS